MQLYKLTVVALILAVRTCQSEIPIATSKPDERIARLLDDLVNIVTSCYKDDMNGIVLAGNLPDSLFRTLTVQHLIPVALVDNVMTYQDHPTPVPVQSRHKLKIFVIGADTWRKLDTLISANLRYSMWWNHMASFFILDPTPRCVNAQNYLFVAWQLNVLNAKVMCRHPKSGTIIFNYNPFTSQAPVPWKRMNVFPGLMKHPFTLFSRMYKENETAWATLDFEKRKDLGGYEIRIEGWDLTNRANIPTMYGLAMYRYWVITGNIFRNILHTLNARGRCNQRVNWDKPITEDIHASFRWILFSWNENALTTYPHFEAGRVIVTQYRGYKSLMNKILSFIDVDSWCGVGIVYLITLIFFKIFVHQALVPALLNLIRITCNTVTIQGIFKSNLPHQLSQTISLQNVDTQQDLVDWGFKKIYGARSSRDTITHPNLTNIYVVNENMTDCFIRVKNDWLTACICVEDDKNLEEIQRYNLHMSREYVAKEHYAIRIRWDWPLEERVNTIIGRMVEHSIIEPLDMKWDPIKLRDHELDREVNSVKVIKVIGLHELRFAFVILGIGLVGATVVFILEFAITLEYSIRIERRQRRNRLIKTVLFLSRLLS